MFRKGDTVKVGKRGSVEYTVYMTHPSGVVSVQSNNTGKFVEYPGEKLVLVQGVEDVAYEAGCSVEELNLPNTERESVTPEEAEKVLTGTVQSPKDEHTSYQKTILGALNILGKHVYAGTAKNRTKRARAKLAKKARRNARKAKTARFVEISNAEQS